MIVVAFSNEFLERDDGWPGLQAAYDLDLKPTGVDHGLAYQAIASGRIDATDAYSDGDLERYALWCSRTTAISSRTTSPCRSHARIYLRRRLPRSVAWPDASTKRARQLNARVSVDGLGFGEVAEAFLIEEGMVATGGHTRGRRSDLAANTLRHLELTGIALLAAVLLGVPLGVLVHGSRQASRVVLYVASLLQ